MAKYLKEFQTVQEYEAAKSGLILPNVSSIANGGGVYYNPIETRVIAKFNVTDTSSPTPISYKSQYYDGTSGFSAIEIDGVELPSVVSAYTFSTTGEHTVKYTLTDPTIIDSLAFYYCHNLTGITIPNSVTSIRNEAFYECSSLIRLVIPDSVTSIGQAAFQYCSGVTNCIIGNGVTSIGKNSFSWCKGLTSIDIPDSVTSIGDSAFSGCRGLTNCTIGSGITSIGNGNFYECSGLETITCNAMTAPTIGNTTFRNIKVNGILYVPQGSSGYDTWMSSDNYYLGQYNWTKVEQ